MSFKDTKLNFLANSDTAMSFYDIQDITDGYSCTGKQQFPTYVPKSYQNSEKIQKN